MVSQKGNRSNWQLPHTSKRTYGHVRILRCLDQRGVLRFGNVQRSSLTAIFTGTDHSECRGSFPDGRRNTADGLHERGVGMGRRGEEQNGQERFHGCILFGRCCRSRMEKILWMKATTRPVVAGCLYFSQGGDATRFCELSNVSGVLSSLQS